MYAYNKPNKDRDQSETKMGIVGLGLSARPE